MVRSLILAVLLAAGASPAPHVPAASPMVAGGWSAAKASDPDVQQAAKALAKQLAGAEWLGALVAPGPITRAERQVVAGTNYRLTFALTHAGAKQQGRAVVYQDLKGTFQLTGLELAPADEPMGEAPTATGLPGGYMAQPANDPMVREAAASVLAQLAKKEWLGRSLRLVGIQRAASQVVAGTKWYVAMTVFDGHRQRPLEAVLYQDPRGTASLSWVALGRR